jgi:hypothetical protein
MREEAAWSLSVERGGWANEGAYKLPDRLYRQRSDTLGLVVAFGGLIVGGKRRRWRLTAKAPHNFVRGRYRRHHRGQHIQRRQSEIASVAESTAPKRRWSRSARSWRISDT